MSNERKLSALLHELQHAQTPLAQARVLARSWRTVRQLSSTDRRLLARQVGFDGAEEILEGLARRTGGFAPALLLQALSNARATDGGEVSELLAAFRDPERRGEAMTTAVDLAADLLTEAEPEKVPQEVSDALEELRAVEESTDDSVRDTFTAPRVSEAGTEVGVEASPMTGSTFDRAQTPDAEPRTGQKPQAPTRQESQPIPASRRIAEPEPSSRPHPLPAEPPAVDWDRWQDAPESPRPAPAPRPDVRPSVTHVGRQRFEARAVLAAVGAESSVFSRLRVLRRELQGISGSSVATLRELVELFPDGWVRRRALCALIDGGIPADAEDALEIVSCLGRELDRRWCLGLLTKRDGLRGNILGRALDLVESSYGKRRLMGLTRTVHESSS